MGQYYYVVNVDKQQYLHPHDFRSGLKLLEFGCDGMSVMTALACLLADGNNRGGGDLRCSNETDPDNLVGSWAGDRIVVAGDYADPHNFLTEDQINKYYKENAEEVKEYKERYPSQLYPLTLHSFAEEYFKNISFDILSVIIASDEYLAEQYLCFLDHKNYSKERYFDRLTEIAQKALIELSHR